MVEATTSERCPFCGGDVMSLFTEPDDGRPEGRSPLVFVGCETCHAMGPSGSDDDAAEQLWDTRPESRPVARAVAGVVESIGWGIGVGIVILAFGVMMAILDWAQAGFLGLAR